MSLCDETDRYFVEMNYLKIKIKLNYQLSQVYKFAKNNVMGGFIQQFEEAVYINILVWNFQIKVHVHTAYSFLYFYF